MVNKYIKEENSIRIPTSTTITDNNFNDEEGSSAVAGSGLEDSNSANGVDDNNNLDYNLDGESLW